MSTSDAKHQLISSIYVTWNSVVQYVGQVLREQPDSDKLTPLKKNSSGVFNANKKSY